MWVPYSSWWFAQRNITNLIFDFTLALETKTSNLNFDIIFFFGMLECNEIMILIVVMLLFISFKSFGFFFLLNSLSQVTRNHLKAVWWVIDHNWVPASTAYPNYTIYQHLCITTIRILLIFFSLAYYVELFVYYYLVDSFTCSTFHL